MNEPASDEEGNLSFSSKGTAAMRAPVQKPIRKAVKSVRSSTTKLLAGCSSGRDVGDYVLADDDISENNSSNSQPSNSRNNAKHHHHRRPLLVKGQQRALNHSDNKLAMSKEVLYPSTSPTSTTAQKDTIT